ncbi:GxxExxY protein [Flavobacterium sp. MMLR14_040]|uniref:GxxExxY protein n=1 Tax=Flavobacterium sp. MMLR14_040 TaxID=3093843 RepID=UPI00298FB648|nr:GxxExxY protein [Flavobacterium sp. MMLR14_040]MDW8850002.1 GxxExxY protein [Flavobacterium sp. MMLR14_040]
MELYRKEEYYKIVGICMEVHRILGGGLLEVVYKDALEYEFRKHNIPFQREKEYNIKYKDIVLAHKFYADFIVYEEIILEIKASKDIIDEHIAQTINYLKLADSDLGIIINFSKKSLEHKRVIH